MKDDLDKGYLYIVDQEDQSPYRWPQGQGGWIIAGWLPTADTPDPWWCYYLAPYIYINGQGIEGDGAVSKSVPLHEMGHRVMDVVYQGNDNVGVPWLEGWGDFWPFVVTNIYNLTHNVEDIGSYTGGDTNSACVVRALWDLYDYVDDGYDEYDGGQATHDMGDIWYVFTSQSPVGTDRDSFSDFWQVLLTRPNLASEAAKTSAARALFQNTIVYPQLRFYLTVNSLGGGTVTQPGIGTFAYSNGQVVELTAVPQPNYHFVNWSGNTFTIANPDAASTTITMNLDYSIQANFALDTTFTLTVSSSPGGTVTTPGIGTFGPYNAGQVVNLVATPDTGYHFVNWTGPVANSNAASTTITMNGNYSIQANFAPNTATYTLTISSGSGGTVATPGIGTFGPYNAGDVVTLIAVPGDNCHFVIWSGDTSTIANPNAGVTTITMNGNYSIQANFAINTYTLTITSGSGGTVTTPGIGTFGPYNAYQVVNLVATPDPNYHFVNWTGAGTIADPNAASTTIIMNYYYSIQANFAPDTTDTTPPAAVTNLAVDTPTSNSLRLTWTAPGDDGNTGTASQYDIRYSTVAINDGNWASATQASGEPAPLPASSAQSFTVTGLNPSTTYYFALKTADEVPNWSALSNSPSGTTLSLTPPSVMTNAATGVTASAATLNGNLTSLGSASTVQVSFEWGLTTDYGNTTSPQPKTTTGTFSANISGLLPGTTYHFRAKAVGDGTSYGDDQVFTTSPSGPVVIIHVSTN